MKNILWHNPRCGKSRKAKEILDESGEVYEIREYLKEVPTKEELQEIINTLDTDIQELVRSKEAGLKNSEVKLLKEKEIIKILLKEPKAMQRPLYQTPGHTIIARPPEKLN